MKTGMIIVNYNDYQSTKKLMDNIKDYSIIDKIVIVDNHSTDDSFQKLKKIKLEKLEVIHSSQNRGYSTAINLGVNHLIEQEGSWNLILSNADLIIHQEEDIKRLLSHLTKKDIGIVAPTILERGNLNRGWKQPSPLLEIGLNLPVIHRILRKKWLFYKENHYEKPTSVVDVVSGCFFLMTSDTFQKINFLDEQIFLYYEENILAKKIQKIGKKTLVDNRVIIVHNHSITIDRNINKIKKYNLQKQSQYYFEKNYNDANKIEQCLLKLTATCTKGILYLVYWVQDLFK